jgi:hypothetical protein
VKNRKKGEVIVSRMLQNAGDLPAIAGAWGVQVDTARGTNMEQTGEPRVVGAAFGTAKNAVSAPIIANGGVYVVSPISEKTQIQIPPDLTRSRRQATSQASTVFRMQLMSAIKKTADIEDFRSRFY